MKQIGFSTCLTLLCILLACSTPPHEPIDPGAITSHLRERITLAEAKESIFGWLEKDIQRVEARLNENVEPEKRASLTDELRILRSLLERLHNRVDSKLSEFNPQTDEIWTYNRYIDEVERRGGEFGIVLIQKGKIIFLQKMIRD